MKLKAWTMAELTIAVIVIIILSAISMSVTKNNNINKARIFVYAALRNLNLGNVAILEANDYNLYPGTAKDSDDSASVTDDWYCLHLVDNFTLKGSPDCTKKYSNSKDATVNFTFTNGVTFQGFGTKWEEAYEGLDYKNVVIDIDGEGGSNKVGVDRFPIRIFKGKTHNGDNANGMIFPVNCDTDRAKDAITKSDGTLFQFPLSPYCNDKFDASGSNKKANLALDTEIITNNIYRVTNAEKATSAQTMAAGRSTIEADCMAHGPKGFYGAKVCSNNGFKLSEKCAHTFVCGGCKDSVNVCPDLDESGTEGSEEKCNEMASKNEEAAGGAYRCVVFLGKPTSGLGMIGSAIMQEMGM